MGKLAAFAFAIATLLAAAAASAPSDIAIVNNSGAALRDLALRRVGDKAWRPLAVVTASGSTARVTFDERDCAYDLRATLPGVGQVIWTGVNLCDVKRVALHRDFSRPPLGRLRLSRGASCRRTGTAIAGTGAGTGCGLTELMSFAPATNGTPRQAAASI